MEEIDWRLERRGSASDPRRVVAGETHDEAQRLGWVAIGSGYRLGLIYDERPTATIGGEGRGGGGVHEEERQALAAADTNAAKDAIATVEVSRKTIPTYPESRNPIFKSLSTM
uniref:Uncharacterized protein n=1 Tax=Cucumis melo TaxID=3656 RepID=A0A9I9E816_CUCME